MIGSSLSPPTTEVTPVPASSHVYTSILVIHCTGGLGSIQQLHFSRYQVPTTGMLSRVPFQRYTVWGIHQD